VNSVIRTEHLGKKFGRFEALSDLNLEVPAGAIYAMVGPNGAGKTTSIKILMNIFPATSGRAEVLGVDSSKLAGQSFTSVGYVSENQQLPDWMRVSDFFAYLRPFYPSWDKDLESELVGQFQLPLDRKLGKLSRGIRVKAALASSLAYRPKLIVLDEPFGGLDPLVRDEVVEGLLERAPESTILVSSHDLAEIENLASHVGYLEQGRLRVSEEMTTLSERFREVELTLDGPSAPREVLPPTWMHINSSAAVLRFIETRFDEERTSAEIRRLFVNVRDVSFTPMSLRSIFLAMAKAGRGSA
jgi:ABC-2 type transport system ATP-binding protein